jgi:hypothetical protein
MTPLVLALSLAAAPLLPHDRCASVFGDASIQEANRARRASRLVDVVENKDGRAVLHAVPSWNDPKSIRLSGIELLGIDDPGDERPAWQRRVARLRLASGDCPSGEYGVGVDASLGQRARVVAVLDDSVLLELDDKLVRLGAGRDDLRMVWQSAFAITVAGGGASSKPNASKRTADRANAKAAADRLMERKERAKSRAAKKKK